MCNSGFLTLADVPGVEGSGHPGLLVVTGATAVAALATRVVFTLTAELLYTHRHRQRQRESQASRRVL